MEARKFVAQKEKTNLLIRAVKAERDRVVDVSIQVRRTETRMEIALGQRSE